MKIQNPLSVIIFGVTGDLYQSKLALALFDLFLKGLLPADFSVFGFARKPFSDLEFQNFTRELIIKKSDSATPEKLEQFLLKFKYVQGDLENIENFCDLRALLGAEDKLRGVCSDKLFYLAVPPTLYSVIFKNISMAGLSVPCAPGVPARNAFSIADAGGEDRQMAWTRILVEKPFGKDTQEAEKLDTMLGELFDESQIFRIDHYLAKETMQEIICFRFVDGTLESKWNNQNIQKVKLIFHERNTVANRGALYDGLGILRDVGQNHMLQMLALVAMEDPGGTDVKSIRSARRAVLEKIILSSGQPIVRGQYAGYLQEENVKPDSDTETFFRVSLGVDNERWRGVVFELEAGKALDKAEVRIEVQFKEGNKVHAFDISASEGIFFDAYEKVLYDCILGDQTIFTTTEEIMAEWRVTENIIKEWQSTPLVIYEKGAKASEIIKAS